MKNRGIGDEFTTVYQRLQSRQSQITELSYSYLVNNQVKSEKLPVKIARFVFNPSESKIEIIFEKFNSPKKNKDYTTQEVADALGVSRPFITKLMDTNKLPCFYVGKHRRIREEDFLNFKMNFKKNQLKGVDQLRKISQEMNLYNHDFNE